jgi:hypothetical protein
VTRLAAILLLIGTAAAARPDARAAAAFRAAFGTSGSATLKRQGENRETVRYKVGGLVETPFGPVLVSPGEVVDAAHASAGKLALVYLRRTQGGFAVVRRFVPATETGSFGEITDWHLSRSFGRLPVVMVEGGGTWQGYTCSWTTLLELAPDGPGELATVPLHYDDEGAVLPGQRKTSIDGRIVHVVGGHSFDIAYRGSKRFTDHYIRRGDDYVLASGRTRMQTC